MGLLLSCGSNEACLPVQFQGLPLTLAEPRQAISTRLCAGDDWVYVSIETSDGIYTNRSEDLGATWLPIDLESLGQAVEGRYALSCAQDQEDRALIVAATSDGVVAIQLDEYAVAERTWALARRGTAVSCAVSSGLGGWLAAWADEEQTWIGHPCGAGVCSQALDVGGSTKIAVAQQEDRWLVLLSSREGVFLVEGAGDAPGASSQLSTTPDVPLTMSVRFDGAEAHAVWVVEGQAGLVVHSWSSKDGEEPAVLSTGVDGTEATVTTGEAFDSICWTDAEQELRCEVSPPGDLGTLREGPRIASSASGLDVAEVAGDYLIVSFVRGPGGRATLRRATLDSLSATRTGRCK